jgi:hypothetical protein
MEERGYNSTILDGGKWSASRLGSIALREWASRTHCIGGWVSPETFLDSLEKREIMAVPRIELRLSSP